jgi:hypothetical protein
MAELRVEPAVLQQVGGEQIARAQELANVANKLRGLAAVAGQPVTPEFDAAFDRYAEVLSYVVDRMVETTDGIGHSIQVAAYRYTEADIAAASSLHAVFTLDALLFVTPDYLANPASGLNR